MKRVKIKEIFSDSISFSGKEVKVGGWCRSIRSSNAVAFIVLNDGSCFETLQIVADESTVDNYRDVTSQNTGTAFIVTGEVILTPEAKQPFEIRAKKIEIAGTSTPDYPLQSKRHSMEYLRTIAHLRPRTNTFNAVFRVRSEAAFAIHSFFNKRGFVYVHTPIITGSDCEGAGEMFRVTTLDVENPERTNEGKVDFSKDFFGKSANLTVSGQLNVECFSMAFSDVYTFGPTFRAELSYTPRHAAEFWMMEPEIAFADLSDDMDLAEDMLKYIIKYLFEKCYSELEFFNQHIDKGLIERLRNVSESDFARVSYGEAMEILAKSGKKFEYPIGWGQDLQTEHERFLTEEYYGRPVFVTDWPSEIKAFYMRLNDDNKTVAAADLLVPGVGELIGGSQREERMDVLDARIKAFNLNQEDYWWYRELRKYGGVPHAGFGLGFERLIMYVTGINNIRDVTAFPRTTGNAEF